MKRTMDNTELVAHLMNYSRNGAMMQLVVIEGLRQYCRGVVTAPAGFFGEVAKMVSEDAWRATCQEYLDALDNRAQFTVDDDEDLED